MDLNNLIKELYKIEKEITKDGCDKCPLRRNCERIDNNTWYSSCDWITGAASELKALQKVLNDPKEQEKLKEFDEEKERIRKEVEAKITENRTTFTTTPMDNAFQNCAMLTDENIKIVSDSLTGKE